MEKLDCPGCIDVRNSDEYKYLAKNCMNCAGCKGKGYILVKFIKQKRILLLETLEINF